MKVLFFDWLHWTYPKEHCLKDFLKAQNVQCVDIIPAKVNFREQKLDIDTRHITVKDTHLGFDLKEFIKVAVAREEGWYGFPTPLVYKYIKEVIWYLDFAYATFDKEKPDWIVVEGGLTHISRALVEVARLMGIKVLVMENSFIANKIFLEFTTGCVCNRHTFARIAKDWLDTRKLNEVERTKALDVIESMKLKYGNTGGFYQKDPTKKYIFVPLQVWHDQVVMYDSTYNNETFCNLMIDLATTVFKDYTLVLKCHPKEEKPTWQRNTGDWLMGGPLPGNIEVVRDGKYDTRFLINMAEFVIVNNSQAGFEACLYGKPVVTLGDAFYSHKGFTIDKEMVDKEGWVWVRTNYKRCVNREKALLYFYYFYEWLYDRTLSVEDRNRITKEMGLV